MAFGTFNSPNSARVKVGATSTPATLVGGLQSANLEGQRPTETDDFLNGQDSDVTVGKRTDRWTFQGKASSGDDGLTVLETAWKDDTGPIIYASGSIEGTNGEVLGIRVSNRSLRFTTNSKVEYNYQLEQAVEAVDLGAGGILD
jgi:hypothetical protein